MSYGTLNTMSSSHIANLEASVAEADAVLQKALRARAAHTAAAKTAREYAKAAENITRSIHVRLEREIYWRRMWNNKCDAELSRIFCPELYAEYNAAKRLAYTASARAKAADAAEFQAGTFAARARNAFWAADRQLAAAQLG